MRPEKRKRGARIVLFLISINSRVMWNLKCQEPKKYMFVVALLREYIIACANPACANRSGLAKFINSKDGWHFYC